MAPLRGFRFLQVGTGPVERRAGTLLALLGAEVVALVDATASDVILADPEAPHHAGRSVLVGTGADVAAMAWSGVVDGSGQMAPGPGVVTVAGVPTGRAGWAASGAMALCGPDDDRPGHHPPGDQAAGLAAAAAVLALLTDLGGHRVTVDGPALVAERAALTGLRRHGPISPGGSCRLLAALDGWVAVNLPRRSDLELIEAWLGEAPGPDPWASVERLVATRAVAGLADAGRELGLAVTPVTTPEQAAADPQAHARGQWFPMAPFLLDGRRPPLAAAVMRTDPLGPVAAPRSLRGSLVVDVSSLWAGPLATSLLAMAGVEVVKVESTTRPDGARTGDPAFFALLNAGKRSVAIDFTAPEAPTQLAELIDGADLVVEASRPRAFEQLGLEPAEWRRRHPAGTWLSITAYGRTGPGRQWAGFGDDAAVAGGLVHRDPAAATRPTFCGDAYADPVAGLHAAVAAAASLIGGGGEIDLALREVVNHLLAEPSEDVGGQEPPAVAPPRARTDRGPAPPLGGADYGAPDPAPTRSVE